MAQDPPTLVYDGECGICRYWVTYWQDLTEDRVIYRAYQEAATDFPSIPVSAFQRAIQLIEPDGHVYSGTAATFRVLRHAPGRTAWWRCYSDLPGFAALTEWAYAFLARRRNLLNLLSKLLWGPSLRVERYTLVSWIFLRVFGAIYVAAFASLGVQILGLIGHDGLLPAGGYFEAAHQALGNSAYRLLPSLFWANSSDTALVAGTVVGMVLGLFVVADKGTRPALVGLFALYLSYVYAGQEFMRFQWDSLLLEAGFLAIFLTGGSKIVVWLYRWLVFRYLFMAGVVKLLSGDPTWHDLTALEYHFWSQPLPTPLAWYAAQLPSRLLIAGTAATLVVELGSVFLIFLPRRIRALAACCVLLFQAFILLTGNYNFFNLLTMLLCVFLFDDAALRRVTARRIESLAQGRVPLPGRSATVIATMLAVIVVPLGLNRIWQTLARKDLPVLGALTRAASPWSIVNSYGLFAVMTTTRPEIVIEGSADGQEWREYVLRYKPGPLSRPALWNIPHQPRLDWQMWFAALGSARENPWMVMLMWRLLEGSPPVLALLESNPFADGPPKYVRAQLYDYRFADRRTHILTGQWWVRRPEGLYFPQVSTADFERALMASLRRRYRAGGVLRHLAFCMGLREGVGWEHGTRSHQRCGMNFLSRLFPRSRKSSFQRTTADRPLRIANPVIGFLNHAGAAGALLSQADQRVLSPLFKVLETSEDLPPRCDVLFLYSTINLEGPISTPAIRELIKSAGAHVAVIASENSADAYIKSVGRRTDWSANIAMIVDRKGDKFAQFFYRLFAEMFKGRSMLMVWAELAPQIPGRTHTDAPDSMMAAEVGHITFQ